MWAHQIWQGFFVNEAASITGVKVVTTTAHGLPHETATRCKQPDALITVPQPPGLYGPLLYPTSVAGTAGLTLDFTVVHPVGKRAAEYVHEDNALQRAFSAKVSKHHGWLQAKNYWFVPVVAATSGALHPATLRLLYDFARLKTDAAELDARAALPTPRSYVRSTSDGGAAVQPPGLSYTAHWEALGSALRFLTTRSIPCTGPVWG
jgi:hypothetical protein